MAFQSVVLKKCTLRWLPKLGGRVVENYKVFLFIYFLSLHCWVRLWIWSYLGCLWDGKSCFSDRTYAFFKNSSHSLSHEPIKEMYDFMKPSMFCHYAHCTSNKAGFHKAAARSHLDRLLRTDWMCRAEWVAPVKCLEPENASTRIRCLFIFIYFDDHCVICISHEGKHAASVRCHSCSGCERTRTLKKNQRGSNVLSEEHSRLPRPWSWNPRGRSVARPAGLGCRRRLAKAGHVKKKEEKK